MTRYLVLMMLCSLVGCGAGDRDGSWASSDRDPVGDDDDDGSSKPGNSKPDNSKKDAGSSRDAGSNSSGKPTNSSGTDDPGDKDFAECADKRLDAERGARGSNIVWVIDNSGSMDEEAQAVQQNLNRFVQSITAAGLEDYRVVVMTKSGFVTVPDPLGSDTKHFLFINENVKSDEPLSDALSRYADYEKFLLKGVVTHFVTVTDDESEITGEVFVNNMKLNTPDFRVHSVASPPGDNSAATRPGSIFDDDKGRGCAGPLGEAADPGVQHWEASRLTNGRTFSICTEDWSSLFGELAEAVEQSAAVPCTVELPEPPPGEQFNPALVNVVFTAPSQTDGDRLPRVENGGACGSKRAWYYDDVKAPTAILLCPSSCMAAAEGGSLSIALGCETFVQ